MLLSVGVCFACSLFLKNKLLVTGELRPESCVCNATNLYLSRIAPAACADTNCTKLNLIFNKSDIQPPTFFQIIFDG